jgi:uncharacterized protein involved in outer membrane biogenesis
MKKWTKILVGVLIALVVLVLALFLTLDIIAKAGIEAGATYALGVQTQLDAANLSLLRGTVKLNGLTVHNPEGYQTPHLMKVGRIEVAADTRSLMSDTVKVSKFHIDGLDVNIEQKPGTSNVAVIMGNVERLGSGDKGEKTDQKKEGGKKVQVDTIVIENVNAHVQLLPVGGKASTLNIKVDKLELKGVTSDNAAGVAIPELTARLVPAILAAIVEKGQGVIPDDLARNLTGSIAGAVQSLGSGAANLANQAGKGLEQSLKGAGQAVKGASGALQGLLQPKKPPEEPNKK